MTAVACCSITHSKHLYLYARGEKVAWSLGRAGRCQVVSTCLIISSLKYYLLHLLFTFIQSNLIILDGCRVLWHPTGGLQPLRFEHTTFGLGVKPSYLTTAQCVMFVRLHNARYI